MSTNLLDMMTMVKNRVNFKGGGFGTKLKLDYSTLDNLTNYVNTVAAIITDYRTHYYY